MKLLPLLLILSNAASSIAFKLALLTPTKYSKVPPEGFQHYPQNLDLCYSLNIDQRKGTLISLINYRNTARKVQYTSYMAFWPYKPDKNYKKSCEGPPPLILNFRDDKEAMRAQYVDLTDSKPIFSKHGFGAFKRLDAEGVVAYFADGFTKSLEPGTAYYQWPSEVTEKEPWRSGFLTHQFLTAHGIGNPSINPEKVYKEITRVLDEILNDYMEEKERNDKKGDDLPTIDLDTDVPLQPKFYKGIQNVALEKQLNEICKFENDNLKECKDRRTYGKAVSRDERKEQKKIDTKPIKESKSSVKENSGTKENPINLAQDGFDVLLPDEMHIDDYLKGSKKRKTDKKEISKHAKSFPVLKDTEPEIENEGPTGFGRKLMSMLALSSNDDLQPDSIDLEIGKSPGSDIQNGQKNAMSKSLPVLLEEGVEVADSFEKNDKIPKSMIELDPITDKYTDFDNFGDKRLEKSPQFGSIDNLDNGSPFSKGFNIDEFLKLSPSQLKLLQTKSSPKFDFFLSNPQPDPTKELDDKESEQQGISYNYEDLNLREFLNKYENADLTSTRDRLLWDALNGSPDGKYDG